MSSYKLTYFNGRGLAELSRLIFAAAGQKYEDYRFPDDEGKSWAAAKPNTLFGKIPELTVDGTLVIPQSAAINRFLGRRFGFMGSNDIEFARIDSIIEQCRDVHAAAYPVKQSGDAAKMEEFMKTTFTTAVQGLEKVAEDNGHFVGGKLSVADIYCFQIVFNLDNEHKIISQYPKVKKIVDGVANNAGIKKWIAERPATPW